MKKLLLFTLFLSALGLGDDRYFFVVEKQQEKAKNRWSLAEWLDQRDRMRMMDLWLALHSPTPYEFYIGGRYNTGSLSSGVYNGGWDLTVAGYASIFGLEFSHTTTNVDSKIGGLVHFRIFGYHAQGTNITLLGGLEQTKRLGNTLINPVAGVSVSFYFNKYFGIEGLFRHHFTGRASNGSSLYLNRWQGGAFIDFSFFRVGGGYYSDSDGGTLALSPSGAFFGAKIFF